jgi:N-acylglucosamine-6-phosphate 2-epimerase
MNAKQKPINLNEFVNQVKNQLIVSCQALPEEPLYGADIMVCMARAAQQGGARALRANTPVDIKAIKHEIDLPLIGIYKENIEGYNVYITPTIDHALAVAVAGAEIIAIDATNQPRPSGDLGEFIKEIHEKTGCLVMADISTYEEGVEAEKLGADLVSTTLSGYTPYSQQLDGPDLELISKLSKTCTIPVIGEGKYHTPDQVIQALDRGATSVVVGGAISRPQQITNRFVKAINSRKS